MKKILLACLFLLPAIQLMAQDIETTASPASSPSLFDVVDTLARHPLATSTQPADSTKKGLEGMKGPIGWLARYLKNTNKPSNKKFDMSLMLGPSYNATTSFSIGALACGLYSWDHQDSTLQKSMVGIFGTVGVKGMVVVGVEGKNFLKGDRWRWNYLLALQHTPAAFWGIGYSAGDQMATYFDTDNNGNRKFNADGTPKTSTAENGGKLTRLGVALNSDFLRRITPSLYIGPSIDIDFTYALKTSEKLLLDENGNAQYHTMKADGSDIDYSKPDKVTPFKDFFGNELNKSVFTFGFGGTFNLDTRDNPLNAYRGVFLKLQQLYYPANTSGSSFGVTDFTFAHYIPTWKNCIMAYEAHSRLSYGDVSWTKMSQVGGSYRMRGYYIGQYRDKNILEGQLELRQRVWKRFGLVAWVGTANIWGQEEFRSNRFLINYGAGFRWEFKKRINIRIDWGKTKHDSNICFNVNEAF